MFKTHIWDIIHNRFKDENDLRWQPHMTAAEWWLQGAFGDPYATDYFMVTEAPVRSSFAGFLARLHRAYNPAGDLKYFADPDEWAWYQEWVLPFHDPLSTEYRTGELDRNTTIYTEVPEKYFSNLRYYIQNYAPEGLFVGGWEWNPYTPPIHSAINKKVIRW